MELTRRHGGVRTARVEPVATADYPTQAARPVYSALDCSHIRKHFGISSQPWQKSLEITIRKHLATP
jgi:dTDP-4-dehydrorhamnose reductase